MSDPSPGSRLGKYDIRAVLGKGAMGTVYDGMDPVIDRRVAIKTVRLPDAGDAEAQESLARFKREAQAAGRLNHPNIVGVFDYGETDALAYIVMEFVDGQTLKEILEGGDRLPLAQTLRIMDDILAGLSYSHTHGVVHRDIKPANIMITKGDHRAKIADFGIARIESSSMTQAGTVLGTPSYMSPEQFMGQTVDRRTDVYSAGVLLYQLLTGERPFEGGLTAIMHKVLNTTAPSPSELSVTAPPKLDAVVARAMARRPEDRFFGADSFAAAIRLAVSEEEPSADATMVAAPPRPAPPSARAAAKSARADAAPGLARRSPSLALLGGGVAALLVVAGLAAWLLLPSSSPQVSARLPPATSDAGTQERTYTQAGTPPVSLPDTPPGATPTRRDPDPAQTQQGTPPAAGPGTAPPSTGTQQPTVDATASATANAGSANPPVQRPTVVASTITSSPATAGQANPAQASGTASASHTPPTVAPPATDLSITPPVAVTPARQPAAIMAALAAELPTLRCTLATAAVSDSGAATITGLAGVGDPAASLQRAVASAEPASTQSRVAIFDGPYCHVLDVLRPISDRTGAGMRPMQISVADGQHALSDNAVIAITATMPEFAGHLQIDYIQHDGTVSHMVPGGGYPDRTYAAGSRTEFGRPRPDFQGWIVGPPFATDMIVAIASTAPIFARARPDGEPVETYLRDLQTAMDTLRRRGGSLAADALTIDTRP